AALRDDFGLPASTVAVEDPAAADPDAILTALRDRLPRRDDLLLVPHSNAGLYLPALACEASVRCAVFVDAILPPPSGSARVAPRRLREPLSGEADETGLLPPWTGWWPESVVAGLFPD